MRPTAALAAAALLAVILSGCSANDVTAAGLENAVGTTFARMYALQQTDLGHTAARADPAAVCTEGSAGAGVWTCTVHYPFPDGHVEGIALEVEVQPVGCYTATAPASLVGAQRIRDTKGRLVTNPLFAFDGCFALR